VFYGVLFVFRFAPGEETHDPELCVSVREVQWTKLRELFYSDALLGLATPKQLALTSGSSMRETHNKLREAMAFLESMAHFATTVAAVAMILSPAAAMASGVAPRLGPGRAIALALRSRFEAVGTTSSQRSAEVKELRAMSTNAARDHYCVVMGPKGVGEFDVASPARN
jgi:hypothetical protein